MLDYLNEYLYSISIRRQVKLQVTVEVGLILDILGVEGEDGGGGVELVDNFVKDETCPVGANIKQPAKVDLV